MAFDYPAFYYDNRLSDATPVASSTALDFNVLNLRDWRNYTWWKPEALPATVTVNCGSAKAADYLLVWGHNLYTCGATIELRGSTDNFGASDVLVATKTPTSDAPFLVRFSSTTYTYWRARVTGPVVPSIAILSFGTALVIPTYLEEGFDPLGREVKGSVNRSEKGNPLGSVFEYESYDRSLTFPWLTWSWLRSNWEVAWAAHLRFKPFVFAWDPGDHATELVYANPAPKYSAPHRPGSYGDLQVGIVGLRST